MIWYVRRGEREIGPLGDDALRALVGTGQITPDTQLRREGLAGWTAALALPGVLGPRGAPAAPATPAAPPTSTAPAVPAARAPDATPSEPSQSSAASAAPSAAIGTARELASPWRRYWARCLDIFVSTLLAAVLIGALRPGLLPQASAAAGRTSIIVLILLPFAFAMDSLICWALGNTPGKAIAGLKVLQKDGRRRLSAGAYLGRNFGVYVFGLALGLPLVSLFTLVYGYRRAADGALSTWDRFFGSRVYALSDGGPRTWIAAATYVLGVATLFALGRHSDHDKSKYVAASTPAPVVQQELSQAANGVNAIAPKMIDRITRLDGAHAGPGSLFTYEYTLTNMRTARLSPGTLETFRWRMSAHVRQAVCQGTALKPMLSTGTTIRFHYRDEEGQELAMVAVSSADCGT